MNKEMESVISRIQKLLSLANVDKNNSSEEAASAMAKAQELLAKYNLDMAVIQDAAKDKVAAQDATGPREKVKINRSAMYAWQQKFWKQLAELNYCFHWVTTVYETRPNGTSRAVKRHVILGSQVNVVTVQMMGDYLTEVMERELPYPNTSRLSSSAISWREGCAERLIERLTEKYNAMRKSGFTAEDGSKVTALAVVDLHEKEYAANYDAQHGAGAYAQMKVRHAKWDEEAARVRKEREEERARLLGSETPEQREKREKAESRAAAKEAAATARWYERYCAREARQEKRRDLAAYARGTKKAESVNLDGQVKGK